MALRLHVDLWVPWRLVSWDLLFCGTSTVA